MTPSPAKQVKFTINDHVIEAPEGANVLQVAKENGIHIAHYCYHEALPIAGVCRLCLVEVDGSPKPIPACNLTVKEGMKVVSNSDKIRDIVKWGLQFHLINHPLDCPICDQAGECILQESYMEYGSYDSNMTESRVHKKKVVDLGPRIVLDKERCILCARCTRFTDHVTQTHDLGIFNRGDRCEIGTFHDKPFDNPYSINTVDICPVGALTGKDFRFKQRVWFTTKHPSVCIKCSTGCSIDVWGNTNGQYRVTPRKNMDINQWWMCDDGRSAYQWLNPEYRYLTALERADHQLTFAETDRAVASLHHALNKNLAATTWLISPQHTTEEYQSIFKFLKSKKVLSDRVFFWYDQPEKINEFDQFLIRGDKHPNSRGLKQQAEAAGYMVDIHRFKKVFLSQKFSHLVILAPENLEAHPDLGSLMTELPKSSVSWIGSVRLPKHAMEAALTRVIPTYVFSEKTGTTINAQGQSQTLTSFMKPNAYTWDLQRVFATEVT